MMEYIFPSALIMQHYEAANQVPFNGLKTFGPEGNATTIRSTILGPDYEWPDHTAVEEVDRVKEELKRAGIRSATPSEGVHDLGEQLAKYRVRIYELENPSQRSEMSTSKWTSSLIERFMSAGKPSVSLDQEPNDRAWEGIIFFFTPEEIPPPEVVNYLASRGIKVREQEKES